MEFRLPENLHHQLLAYDPALKALAKEKKAAEKPPSTKKKAKYPIGNINDLIPANIVDRASMQTAIDRLNISVAPEKHQVFYTRLPSAPGRKIKAILYYWESVWVAAWFPNADEDYLYGFSYAVSTTKAERKGLNRITFNRASMDLEVADMETKKYGRVDYHMHTATVTLDTVCSSGKYHWDPFGVCEWTAKGKLMKRDCIKLFTEEMRIRIPVWKDEYVFARVDKKINNLDHLFGQSLNMFSYKTPEEADVSWVPTAANIGNKICKYLDIPVVVFAKPFVQKELQLACDAAIKTFNDPTATDSRSALKPIKRFIAYMEGIRWIHSLWPDAPIDYYQTYKTALSSIDFNSWGMTHLINNYTKAKQWVQEHMPITSMFLILDKAVREESLKFHDLDLRTISGLTIYALRDTFTMINNVLDADKPLDPPARWRLTEFHDHVQAEAWKIKNTKQDLPQDLFPTPIKITHQEHTWTFLQPMDTHQLSAWGQAVRNCVGTGGYAEDVKKRLQFIVLCMLDGKPKFTIQLKLNQGLMSVQQIAGIGNARLNDDEKALYADTFRQALAVRSAVE
jgi:hypothetical protein